MSQNQNELAAKLKAATLARLQREVSHAVVQVGDYRIPLIGIPAGAGLETCDLCHDLFSIQQIQLSGTQFLCNRCNFHDTRHDTRACVTATPSSAQQESHKRASKALQTKRKVVKQQW